MFKTNVNLYKIIAICLFILLSIPFLYLLIFFTGVMIGKIDFSADMFVGLALIMMLFYIIYLSIFLVWSFRIYRNKELKQNTYFQLGLIFLLGLILPFAFFLSLK